MKTVRQRFNEKWIEAPSGCWEWQTSKDADGYGWFWVEGKTQNAHRFSWSFHNDREIPEGMCICHTCDNPECVNPAHLVCRDVAWNVADRGAKGRSVKGESNGRSKHTALEVEQIRKLLAEGLSQRKIGKIYGIAHSGVWKIKTGKAWSHL